MAAVIVVAGAGFWVWHETPGFCGAICHTPMDPYLATYEEEPAEGAMDKYGNTVDGSTMLAAVHRVDGEATCLFCHKAHTQSVVVCSQCHATDVPEGWLTYDEAKLLVSA